MPVIASVGISDDIEELIVRREADIDEIGVIRESPFSFPQSGAIRKDFSDVDGVSGGDGEVDGVGVVRDSDLRVVIIVDGREGVVPEDGAGEWVKFKEEGVVVFEFGVSDLAGDVEGFEVGR